VEGGRRTPCHLVEKVLAVRRGAWEREKEVAVGWIENPLLLGGTSYLKDVPREGDFHVQEK